MDLTKLGLEYFCRTFGIDSTGDFKIEMVSARNLITPDRIDLLAKIKYVESHETKLNIQYATTIYAHHIEACTLGMFAEEGQPDKNSLEAYIQHFNELIESIKVRGVDPSLSVIPVDMKGMILNGAHRVAIAAYFNLTVPVIRFPVCVQSMNIEFLRKRMLQENDLAYLATELCRWRTDLYLCCLWPAAEGEEKRKQAIEKIKDAGQLVYCKDVRINYNGLKHLIPQIYASHQWIGCMEDRFLSAMPKVEGCYNKNEQLSVVLFTCKSLERVKLLKQEMRAIFEIQENSLHITDFPEETLSIAQMLLHENTIEFLNKGDAFRWITLNQQLAVYRKRIQDENLSLDDFVIDSSVPMGLYGIRNPGDIDYLTVSDRDDAIENDYIHNHKNELKYHKQEIDALIFNPDNYFIYFGVKIITLKVLFAFKENRGEPKDREDITLIVSFMEKRHRVLAALKKIKQQVKRGFRNSFYWTIKKLGLFETVRNVYHKLKLLRK